MRSTKMAGVTAQLLASVGPTPSRCSMTDRRSLLGLFPNFVDSRSMFLLDVAGIEDRLSVQPLEDGPLLRNQHVLCLVHAELVEDGRQLFFEDFPHRNSNAVLEDQVERFHRSFWPYVHSPMRCSIRMGSRQIIVDDDVRKLQI